MLLGSGSIGKACGDGSHGSGYQGASPMSYGPHTSHYAHPTLRIGPHHEFGDNSVSRTGQKSTSFFRASVRGFVENFPVQYGLKAPFELPVLFLSSSTRATTARKDLLITGTDSCRSFRDYSPTNIALSAYAAEVCCFSALDVVGMRRQFLITPTPPYLPGVHVAVFGRNGSKQHAHPEHVLGIICIPRHCRDVRKVQVHMRNNPAETRMPWRWMAGLKLIRDSVRRMTDWLKPLLPLAREVSGMFISDCWPVIAGPVHVVLLSSDAQLPYSLTLIMVITGYLKESQTLDRECSYVICRDCTTVLPLCISEQKTILRTSPALVC